MRSIRRLASAAILGFGMIFASRRRDEHWTERPVAADVEAGAAGRGDGGRCGR